MKYIAMGQSCTVQYVHRTGRVEVVRLNLVFGRALDGGYQLSIERSREPRCWDAKARTGGDIDVVAWGSE